MKNLLYLFAIISMISCSKEEGCNVEAIFTFLDTTTKEPIEDITVEVFGYSSESLFKDYPQTVNQTRMTDENGQIKISSEGLKIGWQVKVISDNFEGTSTKLNTETCITEFPPIEIRRMANLKVTSYDDPDRHYSEVKVVALKTDASNKSVELKIGETKLIAVNPDDVSVIRVLFPQTANSPRFHEDFEITTSGDIVGELSIGL